MLLKRLVYKSLINTNSIYTERVNLLNSLPFGVISKRSRGAFSLREKRLIDGYYQLVRFICRVRRLRDTQNYQNL